MTLYDPDGLLGIIIENLTNSVTGDFTLTLLFFAGMLLFVFMGFGMPKELNLLVITPLLIVLMAFTGEFVLFGVLTFIILSAVFARSFFLS